MAGLSPLVARAAVLALPLAACNGSPAAEPAADSSTEAAIVEKANATVETAQREAGRPPAD